MKPLARLVSTFFTVFPVQRVLIALVALGSIVAAGFALAADAPAPALRWLAAGAAVATLWSAFVTFPCFMACGTVFAALSAPRTFLLLPRFRRRMLAAVLIVFVIGFAPVVMLASFAPQPDLAPAVLGYGFAFFTAFTLLTMLSPTTVIFAMLVLVPALHVLGSLGRHATTVVVPAALAIASAAAWCAFGASYLRGRPVVSRLPMLRDIVAGNLKQPRGKLEALQDWSSDDSAAALTRSASRVVLLGRPPVKPFRQLVTVAATVLVVGLWLALLVRITPPLGDTPWLVVPFVVVPPIGLAAARTMGRARFLWLVGPGREALFRLTESLAGRHALVMCTSGALLTFGLGVWHQGLPPASAGLAAGALLAYGALAVYLGLVFTHGLGAPAALAALLFGVPYVATVVWALNAAEHGTALAASAVFALLAAAACRYAALRRWRDIDWLRLRPRRGTSQRSRAADV